MKKIMLISSAILTIIVMSIITINNMDKNEKNIIKNEEEKEIIKSNMLTLMYETEAGSKEYVATKDNTWPEEGYIFNKNLSGCENGGELEYNSQNNTVNLLTNKSDKCYVYFDKYDGVWINNVVATNITGSSITIDISATSENGSISKYYYQVNESEYIESSNKEITISDLNKLTEYKIEVYAVDNTNAKSNIYELNVSTTDISIPIINNVEVSDIGLFGFTLTVNATSENEISKYYFIIDSEDIAGITSENNYTFSNLNYNTTYKVKIYVLDINDNISKKHSITIETQSPKLFADWIIAQYNNIQGTNGIYYHTGSLANSAGDNSYRYTGKNPNNYVCFGSDATPCPNDNLYRIIGVFGSEVKLIKAISYGSYAWNSDSNKWIGSNIENILNTTYYNSLSIEWQNKIATHIWYVGGYSTNNATPKIFYNAESSGTSWNGKIGLVYVSDFGYAVPPEYWTTTVNNYNTAVNSNWLSLGSNHWTITHDTSNSYNHFVIGFEGNIAWSGNGYMSTSNGILPTFYLNSTVQHIKGIGTQSDPIRLS